jgi:hypothetical protein
MVLSVSEELLIRVLRMLPPEEAGKVLAWAQPLADLGRGRRIDWSGSWSTTIFGMLQPHLSHGLSGWSGKRVEAG